jgi:hypothetical protein
LSIFTFPLEKHFPLLLERLLLPIAVVGFRPLDAKYCRLHHCQFHNM